MDLQNAVIYDVETMPNVFTLDMECLNSENRSTWEISEFRDDRQYLMQWFNYLHQMQIPMIGFNSLHFDYPVIHAIMKNPNMSAWEIYQIAQAIINNNDSFSHTIWPSDRFTPQIDLYKIHHFDNAAKRTSLKALQINMRSKTVKDMPVAHGSTLTFDQVNGLLIPYNVHDVKETKKFALYSMEAMEFRASLIDQMSGDVMNFNDTKLGEKTLEQRLGREVCYRNGKKNQTIRNQIAINDIIFPYVYFNNPEFNRVLNYLRAQVLTPDEFDDSNKIKTKGVFSGLTAHVGGMEFAFGTGGIHGSIEAQKIVSDNQYVIRDIDVASLYPSISIVNRLAPAHLGEKFAYEYEQLLIERRKHKKGTVLNKALKLAANGTYGKSNSLFSVFYDPQWTMTITINGQLMLCMLAEWLLSVPTLQFIQINTDGITYRVDRRYEPIAAQVCQQWERYTLLTLEDANYSRMWIRDVNNYVAESTDGKLKKKGAYFYPSAANYVKDVSNEPAWHKDFNPTIITRAAVEYMTLGIDPEFTIRTAIDPFEFMLRIKIQKSDRLYIGNEQVQSITRYFVARDGSPMVKVSPPPKGANVGDYKRASKIPEATYRQVMAEIGPGVWDERIHTKSKSVHKNRETSVQQGWGIAECNDADDFDFGRIDYNYYISEAKKLIIGD